MPASYRWEDFDRCRGREGSLNLGVELVNWESIHSPSQPTAWRAGRDCVHCSDAVVKFRIQLLNPVVLIFIASAVLITAYVAYRLFRRLR
jgi:hypothetical protein